jgi:hypothetical protein
MTSRLALLTLSVIGNARSPEATMQQASGSALAQRLTHTLDSYSSLQYRRVGRTKSRDALGAGVARILPHLRRNSKNFNAIVNPSAGVQCCEATSLPDS